MNMQIKIGEMQACFFISNFILVKPGFHIVLTIEQHACGPVLKWVLKLSTFRLRIFLVKYENTRLLQLCEVQKACSQTCTCDLYDLYGDQPSKFESCSENVKQERF